MELIDMNQINTNHSKLLTKDQLAEIMHVRSRTIDNWMKGGVLPYLKIGKTVRFEITSVMEKIRSYELGGQR